MIPSNVICVPFSFPFFPIPSFQNDSQQDEATLSFTVRKHGVVANPSRCASAILRPCARPCELDSRPQSLHMLCQVVKHGSI